MLEIIVHETNKRMIGQVKPVNITEVRGFIGLLLLFGVTKKNDICINFILTIQKKKKNHF